MSQWMEIMFIYTITIGCIDAKKIFLSAPISTKVRQQHTNYNWASNFFTNTTGPHYWEEEKKEKKK